MSAELGMTEDEFQEALLQISNSTVAALDELWSVGDSGGDSVSLLDTLTDANAPDSALRTGAGVRVIDFDGPGRPTSGSRAVRLRECPWRTSFENRLSLFAGHCVLPNRRGRLEACRSTNTSAQVAGNGVNCSFAMRPRQCVPGVEVHSSYGFYRRLV